MLRTLRVLLPTVVLAAAFLSGCGDPAAPAWHDASEAGASAGTSGGAEGGAPAGDAVSVVKASFDRSMEAKTFELVAKLDAEGVGVSVTVNAVADTEADEIKLSTDAAGTDLEMVKIGDKIYVKAGGEWIGIDRSKLRKNSNVLTAFEFTQHTGILAGVVSAEKKGDTYTGVADMRKAMEEASASVRDTMQNAVEMAENPTEVPFEATVDGKGRLVELVYTVDTGMGPMKSTLTLRNFGKAVKINAPPASQVRPATAQEYALL